MSTITEHVEGDLARPGVRVTSRARATTSGDESPTGAAFIVGETRRGPVDEPVRIRGMSDFTRHFGDRLGRSLVHDWLETFFAEGGGSAVVMRALADDAETASVEIEDDEANTVLVVEASSPGEWGDDLAVEIEEDGDEFDLTVLLDGRARERYRGLSTAEDAIDALEQSNLVVASEGDEEGTPAAGENPLDGGSDGATVEEEEITSALDLIGADWGPGQVVAPGWDGDSLEDALIEHAQDRNRRALLDPEPGSGAEDLIAQAQRVRSAADDFGRYAALVSSWVEIPAIGRGGRRRKVPGSALLAGKIAAGDVDAGTANNAAAGSRGEADFVVRLDTEFGGEDAYSISRRGVIWLRDDRRLGIRVYGFTTLSSDEAWRELSISRLEMSLRAQAEEVAEDFIFRTLTGTEALRHEFRDAVKSVLLTEYESGGLFGESPEDAFEVDVGPDVNPSEEIAKGNLRAAATIRPAPFGEYVEIDLVRKFAEQ